MLEPQPGFGPGNAAYEAVVLPPKTIAAYNCDLVAITKHHAWYALLRGARGLANRELQSSVPAEYIICIIALGAELTTRTPHGRLQSSCFT